MIYLHEPSINNNEWRYVKQCIDSKWVSSAGGYVKLFEDKIAKTLINILKNKPIYYYFNIKFILII